MSVSTPLISIIMPVYNVEKYISRAIESVLNQSFDDFEFLIVVDGSPDNSEEISMRYAKKDSRIKVLVKENGGVSSARNYGLNKARGQYIYFIDSDDWVAPSLLEENLELLKYKDSDLVVFGFFNIKDNVNRSEFFVEDQLIVKEQDFSLTKKQLKLLGYTWNKIYKKDIIEKNNLKFNEKMPLWEDCVFNFEYLQCANSYVISSKCHYFYNIYEGSASHKSYPDYSAYMDTYENAVMSFINKYQPVNYQESLVAIYSLFLDVLCSELLKSNSLLFKIPFKFYYTKIQLLNFSGLTKKTKLRYIIVRYNLTYLLRFYNFIRN